MGHTVINGMYDVRCIVIIERQGTSWSLKTHTAPVYVLDVNFFTGPHMVFLRGSQVVCTQFLLAGYLSASSELALDQHIFQSSQCQDSTAPLLPPHLLHLLPDEHGQLRTEIGRPL